MSTVGIPPADPALGRPSSNINAPPDSRLYDGRYQKPESSAAAGSSSHPSRSRLDTTVTNIRIARPERDVATPDSRSQDVKQVVEVGAEQKGNVIETRGKTKAEIMREWRKSQGKSSRRRYLKAAND
jgi:hypothetical protein